MTEPLNDLGHAFHFTPFGQLRPLDHDDRKAELTRSVDLGARAGASRVACDQPFDAALAHQRTFTFDRKWPARYDNVSHGKRQLALGWIDESQRIGMLRSGAERADMLAPDREKDARAFIGKRRGGGTDIGNLDPVIPGDARPRRPFKGDQRSSRRLASSDRVTAHLGRKRMRGVDEMGDTLVVDILGEASHATEAADPRRQRLTGRITCAAAIGVDGVEPDVRERICKQAGVTRSTQDEGAYHV